MQWVETHLEETNEGDVLMLPEEVSSLNLDGYVAHPFFALVVLIEYTIRYTKQPPPDIMDLNNVFWTIRFSDRAIAAYAN